MTPDDANAHNKGKTLLDLANELVEKSGGKMDFTAAFLRAKADHPELVNKPKA